MTLEAIKLFLSVEDGVCGRRRRGLVRTAIAAFDASQHGGAMAGDYLEKIVQIPIHRPALGQGDTEAYLAMMLLDQHLAGDERATPDASRALRRAQAAGRDPKCSNLDCPMGMCPTRVRRRLALAGELAPVLFEQLTATEAPQAVSRRVLGANRHRGAPGRGRSRPACLRS